ncbi:MAG TPA: membrane-bound lytic murein transglycosylase MltF [Fontimonas sp.]
MNLTAKPTLGWKSLLRLWRLGPLLLVGTWLTLVSTCSPQASLVDEIRLLGVLRVATVNSPTTYYIGPGGDPVGFEYDLAAQFAQQLGVPLDIKVAASPAEAARMVQDGAVHLAAAGIGISPDPEGNLRFTRPLQAVAPILVYRKGTRKPKTLADVSGSLRVVKDSLPAERLRALDPQAYPNLKWEETSEQEAEELLLAVSNGEIDLTIANSDLVAINQRYHPNLRVAFPVGNAQQLGWAVSASRDDSLLAAAENFLEAYGDAEMSRLRDRYFGHVQQVGALGALTLAAHVETRLPAYRKAFEKAAQRTGLDWRLLAAIGYQESHWDSGAVSPTGVRGIMQLTNDTALRMGVANREDPSQSISGGARYYRMLLDKLPPQIVEPDRSWLALIAYNIGYGHLLDVMDLTQKQGGDPSRWLDVRDRLPLLTQSKWHSKTKYGYARGYEARTYVGNIRTYYDMLVWITGEPPEAPVAVTEPDAGDEKPDVRDESPLGIDLPIL